MFILLPLAAVAALLVLGLGFAVWLAHNAFSPLGSGVLPR